MVIIADDFAFSKDDFIAKLLSHQQQSISKLKVADTDLDQLFEMVQYNEDSDWENDPETELDPDDAIERGKDIALSTKLILQNQDNQILVLQCANADWVDLPGGHVADDESTLDSLAREAKEEIGFEIEDDPDELFVRQIKLGNETKPVIFYHLKLDYTPDIQLSSGHKGSQWVTFEESKALNLGVFHGILAEVFQRSFDNVVIEKQTDTFEDTYPDPASFELYKWADNWLIKAQAPNLPSGAKSIGRGIELHLYDSLKELIQDFLNGLSGQESIDQVLNTVKQLIQYWADTMLVPVEKAFDYLFKAGWQAGISSAGGKIGTFDEKALEVIKHGQYRIGNRIKIFGEEAIEKFATVITEAYTPEGVFDLNHLVKDMNEAVSARRYDLERIARTEMSQVSMFGRLAQWAADSDKYFWTYFWRHSNDARVREMKRIRSDSNPYSFPEIFFLWTHNEQNVPGIGWQMGVINCRCSITRAPSDEELKTNRFVGSTGQFRKTADFDISLLYPEKS